jgi:hypothetical protein
MKFVFRKATGTGLVCPIKPKPKTGSVPFEARLKQMRPGGPVPLIEDLEQTGLRKKLFQKPVL